MKKLLIIIICCLNFNHLSAQKYITDYINDANKLSLQWWEQINSGKYKLAYNSLSEELKKRFSNESWLSQISILMDEFGKLENRTVKDTYFKSQLEGFEDGFYVIIKYDVRYSKTKNHTEYIILKQNDKLKWVIFDFSYEFQNINDSE